jgi:hypothetical protein
MNDRAHFLPALLLAFALLAPSQAQAQDTAAPSPAAAPGATSWKVALRPYFYLAGISGAVTAGGNTTPINSTFGDILDNVKLSLFTAVTAEKGRWGVYGDFQYIDLDATGNGPVATTVGLRNIIGEVDATLRPHAAGGLRALLGVRAYEVDQTVTVGANPPIKASTLVVDPIIGALGEWTLGERWEFELRGDIGGFGASSEFTSQMSIVTLYHLSKTVSIPLGYRTLGYRIKKEKVQMDTEMGGLVIGADIRF